MGYKAEPSCWLPPRSPVNGQGKSHSRRGEVKRGPTLPSTQPGQKGGFWPGATAQAFVCRLGGVSKSPFHKLPSAFSPRWEPLGTARRTSSGRNEASRCRFQSGNAKPAPLAKAESKEKGKPCSVGSGSAALHPYPCLSTEPTIHHPLSRLKPCKKTQQLCREPNHKRTPFPTSPHLPTAQRLGKQ